MIESQRDNRKALLPFFTTFMPNQQLLQQRPKAKEEYRLEEIDGELLLYSPASTRSIYLNTSASVIWQLCSGEHSVEQIITLIQESYPEARDSVATDVLKTIDEFVESDAISLI